MNKNTGLFQSPRTLKSYTYELEEQSRVAYGEFMNPDTKYIETYYQINIYDANTKRRVQFDFVNSADNSAEIVSKVESAVEFVENPPLAANLSSRFD